MVLHYTVKYFKLSLEQWSDNKWISMVMRLSAIGLLALISWINCKEWAISVTLFLYTSNVTNLFVSLTMFHVSNVIVAFLMVNRDSRSYSVILRAIEWQKYCHTIKQRCQTRITILLPKPPRLFGEELEGKPNVTPEGVVLPKEATSPRDT